MIDTNSFSVLPDKRGAFAEAVRLFGNKSDSLREAFTAVVPRVFVSRIRPNTIAESMGLKPGDEILDVYLEVNGDIVPATGRPYSDPIFSKGPPLRMRLPLAHWSLKDLYLEETINSEAKKLQADQVTPTPSFQSALCVVTARATLKMSYISILQQVLQIYTNKLGLSFPLVELPEHYLNAIRKDAAENASGNMNPDNFWKINSEVFGDSFRKATEEIRGRAFWFSGFGVVADSMPEARNLGAVLETRFERRTGLDKNTYLAAVTNLQHTLAIGNASVQGTAEGLAQRLENSDPRSYEDPFRFAEPFEGFAWSDIHRKMKLLAADALHERGGILMQMWFMRKFVPSFDFSIYRGNGVDSLVIYDKGNIVLCLQTLWGSQGGFLQDFIPEHIKLPLLLELKDYARIREWDNNPQTRGSLVVNCLPVQGVWCPMLYRKLVFMPKSPVDGSRVEFEGKPVDVTSNPKGGQLLRAEYMNYFTNTFAFLNHEPALEIQYNDPQDSQPKYAGNRLVPGIVNWPLDTEGNRIDLAAHKNVVLAGNNYTGQLIYRNENNGHTRERFQLFGKTSLVLPILTERTLKMQKFVEQEQAYWNWYLDETSRQKLREDMIRQRILERLILGK